MARVEPKIEMGW